MSRFISWVTIGVAAAFLVVATASFPVATTVWLAFAIAAGTVIASAAVAYANRRDVATLYTALLVLVIGAWTVVASLVFPQATADNLALASSLAISGLALVGLTANELSQEHAARSMADGSSERETHLAAAA